MIVPHCSAFFSQAHQTYAFLTRMATVLGGAGSKPSAALVSAGRRLLELVYRTAPQTFLSQTAVLPMQQQLVLKNLLESAVPDIEVQVVAAGKADWNSRPLTVNTDSRESRVRSSLSSASAVVESGTGTGSVVASSTRPKTASTECASVQGSSRRASVGGSGGPIAIKRPISSSGVAASTTLVKAVSDCKNSGSSMGVGCTVGRVAAGAFVGITSMPSSPYSTAANADSPTTPSVLPLATSTRSAVSTHKDKDSNADGQINGNATSTADTTVTTLASNQQLSRSMTQSETLSPATCVNPFESSPSAESFTGALHIAQSPSPAPSRASPSVLRSSGAGSGKSAAGASAYPALNHDLRSRSQVRSPCSPPSSSSKKPSVAGVEADAGCAIEAEATPQRDLVWILCALQPSAVSSVDKLDAAREIKRLARSGSNEFWRQNCAQIVSVLLEAFHPNMQNQFSANNVKEIGTPIGNDSNWYISQGQHLPLTGLSPATVSAPDSSTDRGSENRSANESNVSEQRKNLMTTISIQQAAINGDSLLLNLFPDATGCEERSPGLDVSILNKGLSASGPAAVCGESMHLACRVLLLIVKFRGVYVRNLMDLVVTRLCAAAAFAPVAVTLHCEQILADLAVLDAPKLIRLVSKYASLPAASQVHIQGDSISSSSAFPSNSPHVRKLALHVLASAIQHSSSADLLIELPTLIPSVLPSFSSALVDLRKAVVFLLVEIYMIVGDVLHSYVSSLLPPQRKLLTIYIERQMAQR